MSVYVDDFYKTGAGDFGRMKMSHLIADTSEELLAMGDKIGMKRSWLQYPGTPREHYDVAMSTRKKAIEAGAISVTWRDMAIIWEKKKAGVWIGEQKKSPEINPGLFDDVQK